MIEPRKRLWPKWYRPFKLPRPATDVIDYVAQRCEVPRDALLGAGRGFRYTIPRQMLFSVLRDRGLSSSTIGRLMHRDHTTVLHGIGRFAMLEARSERLQQMRIDTLAFARGIT